MDSLTCTNCGAPLLSDELEVGLAIISCQSCGAVFDLARRAPAAGAGPLAPVPPRAIGPVSMPAGFGIDLSGGELRITRRWRSPAEEGFLGFGILVVLFGAFWLLCANFEAPQDGGGFSWVAAQGVVLAVTLVFAYRVLAGFLNRTTLRVTPTELSVRHHPLPWGRAPRVPRADIERVWCRRDVMHGEHEKTVTFELRAKTREHDDLVLLRGLPELDHGLWLAQEVQRHLDRRDRPVAGEVREREA